ncbi:neutral zinc metallopeptidase [Nocardia huaxiensis]|uniref:Neutral zinc metallopeptidase n=1 Tax=Nocardia huaxiensis TaxID=2755382 RepID=A0A7D6VCM2_9NOCA|nr:neutral zinc metallopeptidase [Nocardia huaxiensis]QLY29095.1 neutral zinc metallopeptidase [Nocardia huaxiensis]UFS97416.1 neutral zinc metallopeptidase [Nocardia huaxiensis]
MTFNEGLQIDQDRVSSGGGPGMGGGIALGGGALGIIALIATLLLGGDPGSILGQFTGADSQQQGTAQTPDHCKTGADANKYVDCRVVLTVQSLDAVWGTELPKQTRTAYVEPKVRLFSGVINTGCGRASSAVGPFYCPADQTAYFDVSFFQELKDRFGSTGGPLAQEYVVAHEFGHHIQNLLGDLNRAQRDPQGPESGAVRTELQADCYAGVWAYWADKLPAPGSNTPFLEKLTRDNIRDALSAASAVGDDHIQKSSGARVNPEAWTHGSSEQRQKWFLAGYQTGQVSSCDTYSARDLDNPPTLKL